jgi:hypothetical protein
MFYNEYFTCTNLQDEILMEVKTLKGFNLDFFISFIIAATQSYLASDLFEV